MDRTEKTEIAALCMANKEDYILLQYRIRENWRGYTFPGGHIERGESIVNGIIREMKEETGLTITHPKLCGIKQFPIENGRYLVFLFKANKFEGELIPSDEGEMYWIHRSELSQINTVDDFYQLLSVFDNDAITELIYDCNTNKWIFK